MIEDAFGVTCTISKGWRLGRQAEGSRPGQNSGTYF
jgi:hypothetical protein